MSPRTSRIIQTAIGTIGVAGLLLSVGILDRVLRSPGDDNPIGMLAALGIWLSLLPSWGLVRAARGLPLGSGKLWAAAAGLSLLPLVPIMVVFLWMWIA